MDTERNHIHGLRIFGGHNHRNNCFGQFCADGERRDQRPSHCRFMVTSFSRNTWNGQVDHVYSYVSTSISAFVILWVIGASIWGYVFLPRVNRRGCLVLWIISSLMVSILDRFGRLKSDMCPCQMVIDIYRLSVLHNSMDSLQSMGPGSLNSSGDKALFYIFHILPEWLRVALFISNTRQIFDTGLMGDCRYHDETPQELEKRLKGEAKHREKLKLQMLPPPAPAVIRHSI